MSVLFNKTEQKMAVFLSNIPIEKLESYLPIIKETAKKHGKKMRIRYRGPRYDSMRLYCLKSNARAFSVYFD
jgi:hypothetical protein